MLNSGLSESTVFIDGAAEVHNQMQQEEGGQINSTSQTGNQQENKDQMEMGDWMILFFLVIYVFYPLFFGSRPYFCI